MKLAHFVLGIWLIGVCSLPASADVGGLARKAAEVVFQRWGAKAVGSVAALAQRIETLAARHGHEAIEAVKRIGPRTFHLVEQAGAHGKDAARILARHGESAVSWVLSRPKAMGLFVKHGDKAAAVLVKHPGIAEPIIAKFGAPAVRALGATGAQGGRRLAMLAQEGALAKVGRAHELLEVIGKFGDKALTYAWNHKAEVFTAAGITAFLMQPEAFITGAKDLAGIVGTNLVRPVVQIPGAVVTEMARRTNWTLIFLVVGGVFLAILAARFGLLGKWLHRHPSVQHEVNESKPVAPTRNGKAVEDEARGGAK